MTDSTDEGWSEKDGDPRDRPHPSVLSVPVESFDTMHEGTVDGIDAVGGGEV